MRLRERKR